jgi:signal transduction histidine kinase
MKIVFYAPMRHRRVRSADRTAVRSAEPAAEKSPLRPVARRHASSSPALPRALRLAIRTFRRLPNVDVVWLAVRESGSQAAVIRSSDGARSTTCLGLGIEPAAGLGGAALLTGGASCVDFTADTAVPLSDNESSLVAGEGLTRLMVVPLVAFGFAGEARVEGMAYIGARDGVAWSDDTRAAAERIGRTVARAVRDDQRVRDATHRWQGMWEQLAASGDGDDARLDGLAQQIATDTRRILRSGLGTVFRLHTASGALYSLAVDWGSDVSGIVVPVRRGQVLPAGCGGAGRAIALGRTYIAHDYASNVVVPPIMAEAVATLPPITTMSAPLVVGREIIGTLNVGRFRTTPSMRYAADDIRLIEQLAEAAAPLLARAQLGVDRARRHQGASELSRLAGSLTQSLSVSAVCEHLRHSVLALVHGTAAAIWNPRGATMIDHPTPAGILGEPRDARLGLIIDEVTRTRQTFWTPDLDNDPRLARSELSRPAMRHDARAVLVTPLRIRETLLGLLAVTGKTGRAFTDADVELVQALADLAALGIANARAYDELHVSNVQLLRHEKLVAMGRLSSGLAHELRSPLQNVVGLTSEMLERLPASRPEPPSCVDFAEYVRRAYAEARRAADIVDRLLDYVQERTRTFDTVDVRQVVADAVAIVMTGARAACPCIAVVSDETPLLVQADSIMLRQVVVNLLHNAVDAVGTSGTVDVHARLERKAMGDARVIVSVHDTGRGIAPEHLPHVFDLFFTTKEAGHGIGLGLAVCQSLIEQHGGGIRVDSPGIGQGTTIEFELPAKA